MKTPNLLTLASLTLIILSPLGFAQSSDGAVTETETTATKVAPVRTENYEKGDIVPIEREPGDVGAQSSKRPEPAPVNAPLDIMLRPIAPIGFWIDVTSTEGTEGLTFVVVCLYDGRGLIPIMALQDGDQDTMTVNLSLETFAELPLALFAVRFPPNGKLQLSEVRKAGELVERARRNAE